MGSSLLTCPTWNHIFLVLYIIFYTTILTCSKPDLLYDEHCASVVPRSPPSSSPQFATIPFPPKQDGYFLGGGDIFSHPNASSDYYFWSNRKVILFRTDHVYSTDADDVYKVQASLILQTSDMNYGYSYSSHVSGSQRSPLSFDLEGFWSKSTGRICMVGSRSKHSQEGKLHNPAAVLKLDGVGSSTNLTSLLRGTLKSLSSADDSSYFDSISLLMFPKLNYKYTAVTKEMESGCSSGIDVPKESSLRLPLSTPLCSLFPWSKSFELKYGSPCNSSKSCNPLSEAAVYLPQLMTLSVIQCSEDKQSLSFLLEFTNTSYVDHYRAFDPNTTFIAEGSWDTKKNELCVVACRILDATNSLSSSRVDDCSLRMILRFPAVWSIRNTSGAVGHIWSNKPANESGYFDRIMFQSDENYMIPGLKYEYTLVDKARNLCAEKKPASSSKGKQYPVGNSYDMRFDMRYKISKRSGWGSSKPIFVGDQISPKNYDWISSGSSLSSPAARTHLQGPQNISYRMSWESDRFVAEGIYDEETGRLCMMACNQTLLSNDSMDCEIFINLQFPPIISNDYIKGRVESTRQKSDPLYFDPLTFSARSYYWIRERESIWRMDLEIVIALISNTLVCVFVGYQILYAKKHPNIVFPFISFFMLVILTLGSMIPLVLNFEALFFPKESRSNGLIRISGWLEVNEVIVRVITMVAFLLQFRLLLLVWSARMADKNQKASWVAEMKTFYVCLPLYIAGVLIAVSIVNWRRKNLGIGEGMLSTDSNHSLWAVMRSFAGLILDGFLLPQILLNMFQNSIQNALSNFFYIGTTLVRLLPHAYDLYRAHYFAEDLDWSYFYADPGTDYYSTAWDVMIPLGGLLFAAIVYLQQRFGGRFFLPKRFKKELEGYEKVPVANDA